MGGNRDVIPGTRKQTQNSTQPGFFRIAIESRIMKMNRTTALNVCIQGQCKEKRPGKVNWYGESCIWQVRIERS